MNESFKKTALVVMNILGGFLIGGILAVIVISILSINIKDVTTVLGALVAAIGGTLLIAILGYFLLHNLLPKSWRDKNYPK